MTFTKDTESMLGILTNKRTIEVIIQRLSYNEILFTVKLELNLQLKAVVICLI